MFPEELFFEGEDTEKTTQRRAHGLHPALLPRPGLRRYQVDDLYALPLQLSSQGQMKTGGIGQDGHVGRVRCTSTNQLIQLAQDARDVRDHLNDADYRQRPLVDNRPYAGGLHARAGASEKLGVRMAGFQDFHQPGGVQIPGSFACGDEDAHVPPV